MKEIGRHGYHAFFTFDFEGEEQRIDVEAIPLEDLSQEELKAVKSMVDELTKPHKGPPPPAIWVKGVWFDWNPKTGKYEERPWEDAEEEETDGGNGSDGETEETPIHGKGLDQRGGHAPHSP